MARFWKRLRNSIRKRTRRVNYAAYLLSYPKCGRTWLTLQIGRVFQQHFGLDAPNLLKLDLMAAQDPRVPKIRITHDDTPHRRRPNELGTSKKKYARDKVILMVRDPRDVLVSYYFHKSKREREMKFWFFQKRRRESHTPFKGTLSEFLHVQIGGFDTLLRYYNLWAENRSVPKDLLLVRYEDMQRDPERELRRALQFIGLTDVKDDVIAEAVRFASFDNMRKIEAGGAGGSYKLKPGDKNDAESFKVRKGKVGGYADYLKPEEIEMLNRKMAERLTDYYGYTPCRAATGLAAGPPQQASET